MNPTKRANIRSSQMTSNRIAVFFCRRMSQYLLAHPIRALDVDDADVEKNRKTIAVQNENLLDSRNI
jgi:hypothetical protein